jgi:hypothetical protein
MQWPRSRARASPQSSDTIVLARLSDQRVGPAWIPARQRACPCCRCGDTLVSRPAHGALLAAARLRLTDQAFGVSLSSLVSRSLARSSSRMESRRAVRRGNTALSMRLQSAAMAMCAGLHPLEDADDLFLAEPALAHGLPSRSSKQIYSYPLEQIAAGRSRLSWPADHGRRLDRASRVECSIEVKHEGVSGRYAYRYGRMDARL